MITSFERPLYTIKRFSGTTYQITKFKICGQSIHIKDDEVTENDSKLDNAFSRARSMVYQYGMCNPWDYFATLTLDKEKYNRFDLFKYKKDLGQFIRDLRKKYPDNENRISFLFVPENHKDGAWHIHGLINGLPNCEVKRFEGKCYPKYLTENEFYNWESYQRKFGFVSLAKIRNHEATINYTTKYINKDIKALRDLKGEHLYMASRPLKKAEHVADVYAHQRELDECITEHYRFCSVGRFKTNDWTWPYQYSEDMEPFSPSQIVKLQKPVLEVDPVTIDVSSQLKIKEMENLGNVWNYKRV